MDDLAYRLPRHMTRRDFAQSPGARFRFYEHNLDQYTRYSKLDRLMYTIPGLDNVPVNLTQESYGEEMEDMGQVDATPLNSGFYHRFFKFSMPGAMGLHAVARGFNDANMWVAQTSHKDVSAFKSHNCREIVTLPDGRRRMSGCAHHETRFSYALPLEIVYLTPLLSWNPYNVTRNIELERIASRKGKRRRSRREKRAFLGSNKEGYFYITPFKFYQDNDAEPSRRDVSILDVRGKIREVTPSGTRALVEDIPGVGVVRLRWPIAPTHGEGGAGWKELNALKKTVSSAVEDKTKRVILTTFPSISYKYQEHSHLISLSYHDYKRLVDDGETIEVHTVPSQGHIHKLLIEYFASSGEVNGHFRYSHCDGQEGQCFDRHPQPLRQVTDLSEFANTTSSSEDICQ